MSQSATVLPPHVLLVGEDTLCAVQGDVCVLNKHDGAVLQRYTPNGMADVIADEHVLYMNVNWHPRCSVRAVRIQDGTLLWNHDMENRLAGAPVLADGVIYVASNDAVYALRSQDGTQLWRHTITPPALVSSAQKPHLSASPTVANGIVYVASVANAPLKPYLYALDANSGKLLWQVKLAASSSDPLVIMDDELYINTHSGCYALHASDGMLLWRRKNSGGIYLHLVVTEHMVYLGDIKHEFDNSTQPPAWQRKAFLHALRRSDGRQLWHYQPEFEGDTASITTPAATPKRVYIGISDGYLVALDANDGRLLWRYKTNGELLSTPVESDEVVYVGANDGDAYAIRANDGTLLWQTFISKSMSAAASITLAVNDGSHNDSEEAFAQFAEIIQLAREAAMGLQHNYIGTEHILLGLLNEKQVALVPLWRTLGVTLDDIRASVEFIVGRGDRIVLGNIRLTPRSHKVLELAASETFAKYSNEAVRVLFGLLLEGEGIAAGVLGSHDITLEKVRSLL